MNRDTRTDAGLEKPLRSRRETARVRAGRTSAVAGLLVLLIGMAGALAAEDESLEYKVKAGFLYNFAKFVEWPSNSLPAADSPIVIGVFADDPAGPVFQKALQGKLANGRLLTVKFISDSTALANCHMFFLGRAREDRLKDVLARVEGAPVLMVGEVEQFAQRGGIINFVRKEDSFRFEVNLEVAEKAGLKISAKLANMATLVKTRRN